VVDDGSTDDTEKVVMQYVGNDNRFQYWNRPQGKIKGANSCRNYGYELSKGNYIKWFDSDDVMLPNLLEKQVYSVQRNVELSICKLTYFDFDREIFIKENRIFSNQLIEDYLVGKVAFYVSGPLWKRSFLEKQNNLFDEFIANLDDWDFNLRMLYQEPSLVYLDEPLIKYRIHDASLSHEINRLNFDEIKSEFRAREKHLKLIKENGLVNSGVLKNYIKDRYKFLLREALIQNHDKKSYLLIMLLVTQLDILDVKGIIKTIFGFTIFTLFNRGYVLLK
jgi:glycosyltransferase involved in cell wall biosynthesis